ncbi:MAG: hypothetical protein WCJ30_03455 [Deltaproteobacteria bacterium]
MHQTEAGQIEQCRACGAELVSGRDREYVYSEEGEICFDCAIRRGGEYDALHDRWVKSPDVVDLIEREREPRRVGAE